MDATITSENIFRSSSIDAITFNCRPLKMDASVLEKNFGRSRVSLIIKVQTLVHCGLPSDGPQKETFQKV